VSGKPADEEHHYGHGKVESLSALAATALLFLLCGVIMWEALKRLLGAEPPHVEPTIWAFGVTVVSIVVDFFRARLLYRTAAETSSQALEADALHFGSDMWSSAAVLVGLAAVAAGYPWADAAAALVVAAFVCLAGWRLGRRTIETLTDTAPAGAAERIKTAMRDIGDIAGIERVRAREAGDKVFVDLEVEVSRTLPLDRVAALKDEIEKAVRAEIAGAEATVTTVPRALDNETVLERVMVIARNHGLAVHHVTAHSIGGRLSVSFDLVVDGSLGIGAAHDIADKLETAVRRELGADVEVETHIEPLQPDGLAGRDATPERVAEVQAALSQSAEQIGKIRDIHDVRVRETPEGEIVNFHCHVEPTLTVDAVHRNVDDVERALRERWPSIKRVIGHAEPRR
jgi:cation diffusion facilitator family transporter